MFIVTIQVIQRLPPPWYNLLYSRLSHAFPQHHICAILNREIHKPIRTFVYTDIHFSTKMRFDYYSKLFIFTFIYLFFFSFIFISWRLITSQHCSGFGHTLTWISHGVTCIPHHNPPSHLPLHPIPLGLPSAPGPSTCLMHPTWAGDLSHPG